MVEKIIEKSSEKKFLPIISNIDLEENFCDVEGGKENFMEEYGISIYALDILKELGFSENKALSMLAQMRDKDRVRDIDVFMKNGVYEEVAVQILAQMKRKEEKGIYDKYETFKEYGVSKADATKILNDIDINNNRKGRKELEWRKSMEKHGVRGDKVNKILDKINKLFKVKKGILDSFENVGMSVENALEAIDKLYSSDKDRESILNSYGVSDVGIQNILVEINKDEQNKFSLEKHDKTEQYYRDVFPEDYWDSLSLYKKEEIAKQLDFVISVIGDNKKIRVNPGKIRSLRNKNIMGRKFMPSDFKGGAYDSDTINVWNLSDLFNICLLHHESIHLEQQQELRIPGLEVISPEAANKLGYFTWVATYAVGGSVCYIIRHLNFGKVTYSIVSENEAYKNQGNFGYLKDRLSFATFKENVGRKAREETRKSVEKYNYRLEIKEGNYYEKLSTATNKLQKILDGFDGEGHGKILKIKTKLEDIVSSIDELHNEEVNGGEANLKKYDDLGDSYMLIADDIINISDEILELLGEKREIVEGKDEKGVYKKMNTVEEVLDIIRDAGDIKHDIEKNSIINNSSEDSKENYDWHVWNYVYKINDITDVVSILEEKIEQLEDFKVTGKSLSEFEMTPELRKKRDLCISALANEDALYLMYDKIDGEKYGFNPSFDAGYSDDEGYDNKDSEIVEEKKLEAINRTIRFIERTIKNLNLKCHDYETMATKIWLEKEGHQKKSEKNAKETISNLVASLSKEEKKLWQVEEKERNRKVKGDKKERKNLMGEDPVVKLDFRSGM